MVNQSQQVEFNVGMLETVLAWGTKSPNAHTSWHKDMVKLSTLLALCVGNPPVDSPHKGTVMQQFDVYLVGSLNKLLNKQSVIWVAMMPMWQHYDGTLNL